MQFFKNTTIDFIKYQTKVMIFSLSFVIIALIILPLKGISLGIDFTGGTQVIMTFNADVELSKVTDAIKGSNFEEAELKSYGENKISLTIKTKEDLDNSLISETIKNLISSKMPDITMVDASVQNISGKMSQEMIGNSLEAIEFALVLICLYIVVRFSPRYTVFAVIGFLIDFALYKFLWINLFGMFIPLFVLYPIVFKAGFAFGALVATFHDVVVTVAVLEILNVEFNGTVIAALLTIIGYSLNDTIIVFDRIREHLQNMSVVDFNDNDFHDTVNESINRTLSRTIITSLTTFFVVFVLAIFGGTNLYPFAITLCIGLIVGTYSSIFIAAPIMMSRYKNEMNEAKQRELLRIEEEKTNKKNTDGVVL